jgi:hypothetical protein
MERRSVRRKERKKKSIRRNLKARKSKPNLSSLSLFSLCVCLCSIYAQQLSLLLTLLLLHIPSLSLSLSLSRWMSSEESEIPSSSESSHVLPHVLNHAHYVPDFRFPVISFTKIGRPHWTQIDEQLANG